MSGSGTPEKELQRVSPSELMLGLNWRALEVRSHLVLEGDVEGESKRVSKINPVSHCLADFCRGGGRVQLQADAAAVR